MVSFNLTSEQKKQAKFVVVIVFAAFCLGISCLAIVSSKTGPVSDSTPCAAFPTNISAWTAQKQVLAQWNWRYEYTSSTVDGRTSDSALQGGFQTICPSASNDAAFYMLDSNEDKQLLAFTDMQLFSLEQKTTVRDCHGEALFFLKTGSSWQTIVNGVTATVSLQVNLGGEENEANTVAYLDGDSWIGDDIALLSAADNSQIATMTRNTLSLSAWEWQFAITNFDHVAADPRLLTAMASIRSFVNDDGSPLCQTYVLYSGIAVLAVIGLLVFAVIAWLVRKVKSR